MALRRLSRTYCASGQRRCVSSLPDPPTSVPARRVVVTGMGMVTPLGIGVQDSWNNLVKGKCGVKAITDERLAKFPCKVGATVPFGEGESFMDFIEKKESRVQGTPFIAYAMKSAQEAIEDSWLHLANIDPTRVGVAIGSGVGGVADLHTASLQINDGSSRRITPYMVPRALVNLAAGNISIKHGFRGPNHAASTACASGANAIGDAYNFIKYGTADVMVAGGSEAGMEELMFGGFCAARALTTKWNDDPQGASRPFDADRSGFVLGEGAGCFILEELQHAQRRGAPIYAEVRGYGLSSEGYHITAPREDGSGSLLSMQNALHSAGLEPHHIDYINAHATSTPVGDSAEALGIKQLLGEHASSTLVSSTKGAVGHLLGAAGAVEAMFAVLALVHNTAPPTVNLTKLDDAAEGLHVVGPKAESRPLHVAMSNSFGFGGTNSSLVFSSPPALTFEQHGEVFHRIRAAP